MREIRREKLSGKDLGWYMAKNPLSTINPPPVEPGEAGAKSLVGKMNVSMRLIKREADDTYEPPNMEK